MDVLLIAEEPDAIDWLALAFTIRGHRSARANNLAAALQQLERQSFDLIIIDEITDDDERLDLCRQLREHPASQTTAIWITADPHEPSTIVRAIDAGATSFLTRPIDPQQLRGRLELFEQREFPEHDIIEPVETIIEPVVAALPVNDVSDCEPQPEQPAPMFDPQTGLANRDLFVEHLQRSLARSERLNSPVATLLLELPDIASGTEVSGSTLREVASGLQRSIRAADIAARLSEDQFAILLDDVNLYEHAYSVARRIQSTLSVTILPVSVTLSLPGRSRPEDMLDGAIAAHEQLRSEQPGPLPFVGQVEPGMNSSVETGPNPDLPVNERADVIGRFLALEEHLEHLLSKDPPDVEQQAPRRWPD